MQTVGNYSIITTARNEENYIPKTLKSVVHQTVLPYEWVIINDGSNDNTANVIEKYTTSFPWIIYIDLSNFKPELKSTGGRVSHILNYAARKLSKEVDIIVKLDADTQFDEDFFHNLLNEFNKNKYLGIASGTLVFEGQKENINYDQQVTRGAVMLIKSSILKLTNGFFESKGRGEDTLLSIAARYWGFETRSFPYLFDHLKPEGSRHSLCYESFNTGFYKGSIPYRFDYFLFTQLKHFQKKPIIIGSVLQIAGYLYSRFLIFYRPFPSYIMTQLSKEQLDKIKKIIKDRTLNRS